MRLSPGIAHRLARDPRFDRFEPREPVTLLYHGVSDDPQTIDLRLDAFSRHLEFMASSYTVVPWDDDPARSRPGDKVRVVLTFDDGFGNNAEVVAPALERLGLPAVFFICTRHCAGAEYLWFRHLDLVEKHYPGTVLEFEGRSWDMSSAAARRATIAAIGDILIDLEPHPTAMYEAIRAGLPRLEDFASEAVLREARGMTPDEVRAVASNKLFTIAAHTVDHPYLTRCEAAEARRQMAESKLWIEQTTGRECPFMAYPSGDYDATTMRLAREVGFTRAFAVRPRVGKDPRMETGRFGVHREGVDDLAIKVRWGTWLRRLGRPVN